MRAAIVVAGLVSLGLGLLSLGGCVFYLNPLCTDQIQNGEETGVDCGGTCGKCDLGQGCRSNNDCDEANCTGGVCTAFPCDNGKLDTGETDVDCGGGMCRACAGGRKCLVDADCFSGTCSLATKTCSQLTVSFAAEDRYFSGFKAYALLSGDLTGGGHTDLAVINEYGSSIAMFENNYATGGAFTRVNNPAGKPPDESNSMALNFGPTGAYPTGGGVADFNHDGKLDVVTADYHGNSVTVLLAGMGGMLNAGTTSYPTQDKAETSNLAVGDLNKDGNPDVVATNPQRASVSVFLSHPDGTLDPAVNLPVGVSGGAQPYSAAIADFDGDGNNDLAIAEETSGTIIVRLGHGDATFGPEVPYEIDGTRDYILIARDMNLDGKIDLVCANRNGDNVSVLLGRGDGTFRKAIVASVGPPGGKCTGGPPCYGPYSIAVADINQDGVPDIVVPNFVGNSVSILLGTGDGHYDPAIELKYGAPPPNDMGITTTTPYGIVAGDFNGDGKPDFATANAGSDDLTVRINTGQPK
ncbi:MAG TPA: VCBS repeat-containing protein [Kofleriaceae bacterium]|nr:VCBS repeat-containing protein [Kofleriaceae bacterium]